MSYIKNRIKSYAKIISTSNKEVLNQLDFDALPDSSAIKATSIIFVLENSGLDTSSFIELSNRFMQKSDTIIFEDLEPLHKEISGLIIASKINYTALKYGVELGHFIFVLIEKFEQYKLFEAKIRKDIQSIKNIHSY